MKLTLDLETQAPQVTHDAPILIVDDNIEFAQLLKQTIEAWDVPNPVHHLLDGAMLLEYLTVCFTIGAWVQPLPAAILLDLNMPNIDGLEVVEWIKKSGFDNIRVIIVSGELSPRVKAKLQKLGTKYFLSKPLGAADYETIQEVLRIAGTNVPLKMTVAA